MNRYNTGTTELVIVVDERGTLRLRLVAALHFTRHLGEMVNHLPVDVLDECSHRSLGERSLCRANRPVAA